MVDQTGVATERPLALAWGGERAQISQRIDRVFAIDLAEETSAKGARP
jgi:hypothetical protein